MKVFAGTLNKQGALEGEVMETEKKRGRTPQAPSRRASPFGAITSLFPMTSAKPESLSHVEPICSPPVFSSLEGESSWLSRSERVVIRSNIARTTAAFLVTGGSASSTPQSFLAERGGVNIGGP